MVFLSISLVLIAGDFEGFLRIPQVKSFLNSASRTLSGTDISRIPEVVAQELQHILPLLKAIGKSIVDLDQLEPEIDCEGGRRYPSIPSLIHSPPHVLPSHARSPIAPIPGSADESKTFGSAPLSATPLAAVPRSSSSSPSLTARKVARKPGNMRTKSPGWPNPMTKNGGTAQRKRHIHEVDHELPLDGLWKRRKAS
jgi:hypothetical protein